MRPTPPPRLSAVTFGFLCACAPTIPEDKASLETGTPTEEVVDCDTVITATDPFDGQADHYWRDPLVVTFSEPDPSAGVVFDTAGTSAWDDSGTVLTFTPTAPLEPGQDYALGIDFCQGTPELSFQTADFGSPIADPVALVGSTFEVELSSGRFVEGAGIAEPLSGFFNRSVYFQVMGMGPAGLDLRVAMSGVPTAPVGQDLCFPTVDLTGLDASEAPYFAFDVDDFVLGAWEGSLAMLDFHLEGTISADGGVVGGVGYSATVPVSQLGALFDIDDVAETCALIEQQGVSCETCPDFSDAACVTVSANRIEATRVDVDLDAVDTPAGDCDG